MSIGLYDADVANYTHVAPNLELMKMATYYKRHNEITVLDLDFKPELYSKYKYRKDYDDSIYEEGLTSYKNIEMGGYAFSNGIYRPMPLEIEQVVPDTHIYDKVLPRFGTTKTLTNVYKSVLGANHLRLSLDGKTIWSDYEKQISPTQRNYNFFFHDFDLNQIKDSHLLIKDLVKDQPLIGRGIVSTKFPIQVYNEDDMEKWLNIKGSLFFYNFTYYGLMSDEFFRHYLEVNLKTSIMSEIQYIVTWGFKDQQDFVDNGIEKLYKQLILACSNQKKILLSYQDGFFTDKRWEKVFELLTCFNNAMAHMRRDVFRKYGRRNSLYTFVYKLKEKRVFKTDIITKPEARELFYFVHDQNPNLFKMFYEDCLTEKIMEE